MNAIDDAVAPRRRPRIATRWLFRLAGLAFWLAVPMPAVSKAADPPAGKMTDQVVVATSDGRGTPTKWNGEILDFTGHGLQLRVAGGHEKLLPAARIVAISTTRSAEQQAGDAAFGQGNFRRALGHYRAALEGKQETREWVRRQILAQIVWCYQALGAWESACDYFLILLERDPTTPYFDCLPLAWLPEEPSPSLAKKAKQWLAKTDTPVRTLLGASHLLSTADRPAAVEALGRLSTDHDPRIALLAEAQGWRTVAFQATDKQTTAWQQAAAKMPEDLRAGPDFMIGSALAPRHPAEAIVWLLRPAILYPRERQVAAAGLAAAAAALDKLDRHAEALLLWTEIATAFADQALLAKQARATWREAKPQSRPCRVDDPGRTGRPAIRRRIAAARIVRLGRRLLPQPSGRPATGRSRAGGTGDRPGPHVGRARVDSAGRRARAALAGDRQIHDRLPAGTSA